MTLLGNAERWLARLDLFLPEPLRSSDDETRMRGRLFAITVIAALVIALNGAAIHFRNDAPERGFLILGCLLPAVATLTLARSRRGLHLGLSIFLGILLLGLIVGPYLTQDAIPISVAAATIPILAVGVGGLTLGMAWTGVTVLIISASAVAVRNDPAATLIVGNTLIAAGAGGIGCCFLELLRKLENKNARLSAEQVKAEAIRRISIEADLEQSRTIISESFRLAPTLFIMAELPSMRITDVNESFERISGWSLAEAKGRTLTELGAWNSPEDRLPLFKSIGSDGRTKQVEIQLRTRTGEPIWLLAAASLVHLGNQAHVLAQAIDITDRKAATEALTRHRDSLETRLDINDAALRESMRELAEQRHLASIGTLAAGIAHQINNPVGAIMAAAEFALILPEGDPDRERQRDEALHTAVAESQRCGRIVRNLLRFARHEPTARWVEDITPLVSRAVELTRSYVTESGGELQTAIGDEVLLAMISPIELEEALVNLIRNAAESLEGGGRIEVRTTRREGIAEIEVRDNGHGIDEEELNHVFEPFYTTRLREGGTGLGLSFAHGVALGHGGELLLDSSPEKGTRARLRLQLAEPEDTTGPPSSTQA
ncbi:MAG: ATP-binding protein [Myxococcota bacterium]